MEDSLIFLDAGFLAKLSKYFGNGKYIQFDIIKFSKNLAKKQNLFIKHIFYATAPPFQDTFPTKEERNRKLNYDKFKVRLSKISNLTFLEGRVQRLKLLDGQFNYSQKGVDTVLTMALSSSPGDFKEIKKYILVACDTDFSPVAEMLKSKGIEVILYSYYEKKRDNNFSRSHHLIDSCSKYIKLTKQDFDNSPLLKEDIKDEK